jgi:hypothetical protein
LVVGNLQTKGRLTEKMKQEKLTMGAAFFGIFLCAIGLFNKNSFKWGGAGKLRK